MRNPTVLACFLATSAIFLGLQTGIAADLPASSEESRCAQPKQQGRNKAGPEEERRRDIVVPPETPRPRTVSA